MLTFDSEKHIYYWNGKRVCSVTEIIGEWLPVKGADYYVNTFTGAIVYADKFEAARQTGQAIHKACGYIAKGQGVDMEAIDPILIPPLKQFKKWMKDFRVEPIEVETPMYSEKYGFAGTPDLVGTLSRDKAVALIEIKTGLDNPFAGVQTAAYELLVRDSEKIKQIIKRYELILPRDGSIYKFKPLTDRRDLDFFNALYVQYQFLRRE